MGAEDQPPVDIPYDGVAEWLLNRRHLKRDWRQRLAVLKQKLRSIEGDDVLTSDLDEKAMVSGIVLSYEVAVKKAEKAGWGSRIGALKAAYERQLLHLAEAALVLANVGQVEIPLQNEIIAGKQKELEDLDRRQAEANRALSAARMRKTALFEEYNIRPGDDTRRALDLKVKDLSNVIKSSVAKALGEHSVHLARAMDMYKYDLPNLRFFMECIADDGQVPPHEYAKFQVEEGELEDLASDWNMVHTSEAQIGESDIEFQNISESFATGVDSEVADSAPIEIDWGISIDKDCTTEASDEIYSNPSAAQHDDAEVPIEIDWSVDVKVELEAWNASDANIVEDKGVDHSIWALTANPKIGFRVSLLDDFAEIDSFLKIREHELVSSDKSAIVTQLQASSQFLESGLVCDVGLLRSCQTAVQETEACLSGPAVSGMVAMATSARYKERIAITIDQAVSTEDKIAKSIGDMIAKKDQILGKISETRTKLNSIKGEAKSLKSNLESLISTCVLKGRPVNLVGKIAL